MQSVKLGLPLVNAHLKVFFVGKAFNQEEQMVWPVNVNQCFSLATLGLMELSHVKSVHIA